MKRKTDEEIPVIAVRICRSQDEALDLAVDLTHAFPLNSFRLTIETKIPLFRVEAITPDPTIYDSISGFADGWSRARHRYYEVKV